MTIVMFGGKRGRLASRKTPSRPMIYDLADLNYSYNVSDDPFSLLDREWSDTPKETLSRTGFIVLSVFLGLIMTFGFLNNFVVLLLFCKFKKLRTPVNMLLLNISVSDMLVCMFGTTLSFTSSIKGKWLLGRHGCLWYGFINSCFGESVGCLLAYKGSLHAL
ncbi:unnamed protein product [Oncorhynchus mykiss]|uniref:G-protein coupled receptors family 1 profile domain-containing protein n=1 Tax=Oncorhynchus mykiss TaxID=8022 RepID=A0A060X0I5_ONCMY|nr:unnamed protein product [Oncorhynchus mykiss]